MFKKSADNQPSKPSAPARSAGRSASGGEGGISIIGPGMHIVGDLVTDGTVRVEGKIEGSIRAENAVVLGKGGEILGEVFTQDAVVGGRVRGTLTVQGRLELQSTCVIEGDISAPSEHLKLDEGARFNGQIRMATEEDARAEPLRALPAEAAAAPKEE